MKKKNLNLILGSILTGLVLLVVLVGIFYTPYDPTAMDNANKLSGVTLAHPFGCDNFGRDIPVSYTHLDVYKRQACMIP